MTDLELRTMVLAVVAAGLLVADKYYVEGSDLRPHDEWDERIDKLVANASVIAGCIVDAGGNI